MDLFKQYNATSVLFEDEYQSLFQAFDHKAITSFDLLMLSSAELARLSGRSSIIIKKLQQRLETEISNGMNSIETINSDESFDLDLNKKFSSGDEEIDSLLDGGISIGDITEVVGASATGKSHLLLQMAVSVQLPREFGGMGYELSTLHDQPEEGGKVNSPRHRQAKVVYISTESGIETRRLKQICDNFNTLMETNGIEQKYWPSIENVYQITCNDLESQNNVIFYQLPQLLKQQDGTIKLVIIDSIAHHLRIEMNTRDQLGLKQNLSYLYKLANFLKKLAQEQEFAICVSNQVSDRPMRQIYGPDPGLTFDYQLGWLSGWDKSAIIERQRYQEWDATSCLSSSSFNTSFSTDNNKYESHGNRQVPALGIIWQNKVDHRIVLSKYKQPILDELLESIREREAERNMKRHKRDLAARQQAAQLLNITNLDADNNEQQPEHDPVARPDLKPEEEEEEEEDEYEYEEADISRHFELKRKIWYKDRSIHYEIWKGGIRSQRQISTE